MDQRRKKALLLNGLQSLAVRKHRIPEDNCHSDTLWMSCSLSPSIPVTWLDGPMEVIRTAFGDQKKHDYLAINPKSQVPALRFDGGDVLTEAAAVLARLGATQGGDGYVRDTYLVRMEARA